MGVLGDGARKLSQMDNPVVANVHDFGDGKGRASAGKDVGTSHDLRRTDGLVGKRPRQARVVLGVPAGGPSPVEDAAITVLATSAAQWAPLSEAKKLGAFDYFGRALTTPRSQGAEVVCWERPTGGRVFNAGSVGAGWALAADPKLAALVHNALFHLGARSETRPSP